MIKYRLIATSVENFKISRERNFDLEGFHEKMKRRVQKVRVGDKFVYYIAGIQRIGAISEATDKPYYDDKTRIWSEKDEIWPYRYKTRPVLVLDDEVMVDVRRVIPHLTFISPQQKTKGWGLAFHQSLREISPEDFKLIESEMRKAVLNPPPPSLSLTEAEAKKAIMDDPNLESSSLHDRLGEMLAILGSRMEFNTFTRHRVTPDHAVELDVAWLRGRNPELAVEVQIGGNITEAKDKLAQARKFNYRKVIMVIEESQLSRLNAIVKFDELMDWLEAWSIQSVLRLYTSGISFLNLYERLTESRYQKRNEVEFIRE